MDDDPNCWTENVRCRVGAEFVNTCDLFMGGSLESVSIPFVTFHGVNDTYTDTLGSETLFKLARSTDKTYLKVGPGCDVDANIWHNMTNEPGHEVVQERTLTWLAARA